MSIQSQSRQDRLQTMQWQHFWLGLVMLGYALTFLFAVYNLDTARDLYWAQMIVQGDQVVFNGPDIGGQFHLGPVWFYVLAAFHALLPLSLVAVLVGLLASMQFYWAYRLGTAWVDWRFGLLWAAALLLPGWHNLSALVLLHTSWVISLSLGFVWILWRFHQTGLNRYLIGSGLVLGLATHAHPTTAICGLLWLPVLWGRPLRQHAWGAVLALILAGLPLLPMMIYQAQHGFPDWARWLSQDAATDQLRATGKQANQSTPFIQHALGNAWAMLWSGPKRMIDFAAITWPILGWLMWLTCGLALILAITGWVLLLIQRRWKLLVTLLLVWAVVLVWISALRAFTPQYMLYVAAPVVAGIMALGWAAVVPWLKATGLKLWLLWLAAMAGSWVLSFKHTAQTGQVHFGPLMDVQATPPTNWQNNGFSLDALMLQDSDQMGRFFCDQFTVVNGPLTVVFELTSAVMPRLVCDDFKVRLGGEAANGARGVLVMHRSFWQRIEQQPDVWITPSWGGTRQFNNHTPDAGIDLMPYDQQIHPPRSEQVLGAAESRTVRLTANADSVVSITHMLPASSGFQLQSVQAHGQDIKPLIQNIGNGLFRCEDCGGGAVAWTVTFQSNAPESVDVNVIR